MKKRLVGIVAGVCAICIMLSGCGKNNNTVVNEGFVEDSNVTEAGQLPVVKEKIKLTIGVMGTANVQDYKTNAYTKFLEEKTGIELEFYEFPSSGGYEKLNVMLASNSELPEVVVGFGLAKNVYTKYASEGTFVDLTPYMEKYGYWIKEMEKKSKVENFNAWLTASDGKKYFMPSAAEQTGNMYSGKAFINKKWLDKLGLEMPKTTEDFKNVMHAFITQDPNGNGKNDEIGFTGSKDGWNEKPVNFLVNSFIYDDYDRGFVVENGKISLNYLSDKYKEAMKYVADLAKGGELDVQCYTQGNDILRSICASDTPIVGAFASGGPDGLFVDNPEVLQDYVALPPLEGPDGTAFTLKNPFSISGAGFITKYCKNPAAAFRLLDFMLSEEASVFSRYGVEGPDWKRVEAGESCMFESIGAEAKFLSILPYSAIQNSHWHQYNPQYLPSEWCDTIAWNGDELDGEYVKAKALTAYYGKGPEETFKPVMMLLDTAEMEEYDMLLNDINGYVKGEIAEFVSGGKDIDKDWASFQASLKKMGVERYLELVQKGYDNFKAAGK